MQHERGWTTAAFWLVLLALALGGGAVVIRAAVGANVLPAGDTMLRLSADYGAEPRSVRTRSIAPVEWAVVGDTFHDLAVEQIHVPPIDLMTVPNAAVPTAHPTPLVLRRQAPLAFLTATPGSDSPLLNDVESATPTIGAPLLDDTPQTSRDTGGPRGTRRPGLAPAPTSTALVGSTNTPAPSSKTDVPPTATAVVPSASPVPPVATGIPPSPSPVPPTATPEPPTATPEPPTDTPVPQSDTPVPLDLPTAPILPSPDLVG